MTAPIAVQLYTVRELLESDYDRVIERLASMGYAGVEYLTLSVKSAREASRLFQSYGLKVPSAHLPLPLGEMQGEVLETASLLGCSRLIAGFMPPEGFKTVDGIRKNCDLLNEAGRVAAENGLQFGFHNHWWEFKTLGEDFVYRIMLNELDPNIFWEIDTYWAATAGCDPVSVVREFGERAPLLHLKDGPATTPEAAMVAVGQGSLDFPSIVEAGSDHTEWLIVELDRCDTDMMEAVEQSYQYLVAEGLGRGRADQ